MSIKYAVEKCRIGFGSSKKDAYVGRIQLGDTVETDMLVEQVSLHTGMTRAQIKMVLDNLTDSILHFCKLGSGVRLGNLGIIKPAINSKSADDADDVKVVKLRYRYLPSVDMKNALKELEIRKKDESADSGVVDEDEEEDDNGGGDGGQDFT